MSLQIRVSPDVLRQEADKIKISYGQSDKLGLHIKTIANKLDAAWDGSSSKETVDKLLDLSNNLQIATNSLQEHSSLLQTVAQTFEQIDSIESDLSFSTLNMPHPPILGPGGRLDFLQILKLSSETIRVIPDELREVANESKEIINESTEVINNLEQVSNELQNSWEGRAYTNFVEKFNEVKKFYMDLVESLEEFSQKIVSVADRYEEIDGLLANI